MIEKRNRDPRRDPQCGDVLISSEFSSIPDTIRVVKRTNVGVTYRLPWELRWMPLRGWRNFMMMAQVAHIAEADELEK